MTEFEAAEHNKDMESAEDYFGNSFQWQGTDYPCLTSNESLEYDLGTGGRSTIKTLKVTVRTELFGDASSYPQPDNVITFNSSNYKVSNVRLDASGLVLVLNGV